jgi:hypothetical protein
MPPPNLWTDNSGTTWPYAWPPSGSILFIEFYGTTCGINGCYHTDITPAFNNALLTAYYNWNAASIPDNSHVSWSFGGYAPPLTLPGQPIQPWHQWKLVDPADIYPAIAVTGLSLVNYYPIGQGVYYKLGTANTRWANNDTEPATTAAHEIGHTMGLGDCPFCLAGSAGTIMSYENQNGWAAPSSCDDVQVYLTAFQ